MNLKWTKNSSKNWHMQAVSNQPSELYHISGVRTQIQNVKPKMAEFEELKTSILVLCAVNVVTKTLVQ